jgi:FlaA1/EpsC-like NDP-sugar epimerase
MGAKPGEKLDEMLISHHEAPLSYCFDNNYYVILPSNASDELKARYRMCKPFPHAEFSSRTELMDLSSIKTMLIKGGFLCE